MPTIFKEGTDDEKGIRTLEGEDEGCDTTIRGDVGTTTGGGVCSIIGDGVGTITGGGDGTKGGRGVGTIIGGSVGTITRGGVDSITRGGVPSTIGTDGDGNDMGIRAGEGVCKGPLCVSRIVDGVDVDGIIRGTFIR